MIKKYKKGCRMWFLLLTTLALITLTSGCASLQGTLRDKPSHLSEHDKDTSKKSVELGDQAMASGDVNHALYNYIKALNDNPNDMETLYKVATIQDSQKNYDLAATAYRHILEKIPHHAGASQGFGLYLLRNKDLKDAKHFLQTAVHENPNLWHAQNGLGVIADLENHHDVAKQHYNTALRIMPNSPLLLNNLGYSMYLSGEWKKAQAQYEKAITISQHDIRAWSNLGLLFAREGHFEDSYLAFKKVMNDADALHSVGYICMVTGQFKQAESYLMRAKHISASYLPGVDDDLTFVRTKLLQSDSSKNLANAELAQDK